MQCGKCGFALTENQLFCPNCGQPVGRQIHQQALKALAQKQDEQGLRRLSHFWYLFAGLNAVLGLAGILVFVTGVTSVSGPWEPWPHPPGWGWTMAGGLVWVIWISRVALAALAGWALQIHADWAVPVAVVAGAVAFTQFPIGLVMGAYVVAFLVMRRHSNLQRHSA